MGGSYAEATRKLIHADFGKGFSMAKPRLQEAFYQDVMCELERLEKRMEDPWCLQLMYIYTIKTLICNGVAKD